MIKGMEISFLDSLLISATGLGVVLLELAMLAVIIMIMSKVAERLKKRKSEVVPEELAAILAAVCEASGLPPEQLEIISVKRISG